MPGSPKFSSNQWQPDNRQPQLNPGMPRYNARFDRDKLSCYYCCCQCGDCCMGAQLDRTYLDIYNNAVQLNRVSSLCLGRCCYTDHPRITHYDRSYFRDAPRRATCCSPCCPFPCINFCDYCGEVVVFESTFACCGTDSPPGFRTWCNGICWVAAVYGLATGEAERIVDQVEGALINYRQQMGVVLEMS